jgi:small subunit ribosomal protein S16
LDRRPTLYPAVVRPFELPPGVHPTLQAIGSTSFYTFWRIVAVKIRLKRLGKIRAPYYRIVVADSRTKRDGRVIEEIGKYHPTENPSFIEVDSDRAQYWLSVGAQPTEQVAAILKLTGDWGKFKGDKNAKSTVLTAEPKAGFAVDEAKKSVVKPKAEKPAEKPAEEPAAEAADETASDEA